MRIIFATIVWLAISNSTFAFEQIETACQNTLDCAANSVVSLLPDWPENFTRNEEPEGSGIVLGDGTLIATADHVLGPASSARIRTRDGKIINATVIVREPLTDIALLKVSTPLTPFNSQTDAVFGEPACALGNSFGLDISVSCGVVSGVNVSGVGFNQIEDFVQTDAAVNPGMSGGALVDEEGNLVGLLSAIFTKGSDGSLGVNFAVSSKLLFTIINDYEKDGKVSPTRSGILARPANLEKTNGRIGIEIVRILPDSREEKNGIKVGDIVFKLGNKNIKSLAAYAAAIATVGNDENINLMIWRNGTELNINLEAK